MSALTTEIHVTVASLDAGVWGHQTDCCAAGCADRSPHDRYQHALSVRFARAQEDVSRGEVIVVDDATGEVIA